jgi:hypothetical protein
MNPTTAENEEVVTEKSADALEQDIQSDTLTSHDRCDIRGCGSQAYVKAELASGDLLFCSHHYNEVEAKIQPLVAEIFDERWKLYKTVKLDVSA